LNLAERIEQLTDRDNMRACAAMRALEAESAASDAVAAYLPLFLTLMDDRRSYVRTRGLRLAAANARWDADGVIDARIEDFLRHIGDEKPITARQCIQCLPQLAKDKPQLRQRILDALGAANPDAYAPSMAPLVRRDIEEALRNI
jgi:hypothetical protein